MNGHCPSLRAGETEPGLRPALACTHIIVHVFPSADLQCPNGLKCANVPKVRKKDNEPPAPFSGNEVFIIGAGHFGKRAVGVLSSRRNTSLWVVEKDERALGRITGPMVERVLAEGVPFLMDHAHLLPPATIIVPALPIHLAFEWLRKALKKNARHRRVKVPAQIKPLLPHTWEGREGSLLVSYADFRCPDDCPEPADHCTVTGKKRGKPLYELLGDIALAGFRVHVIRSRQLAPGVGGYSVGDLRGLLERVESGGDSKWLVGTACKCHGVISALAVKKKVQTQSSPWAANK
jgi:hypothetical protein